MKRLLRGISALLVVTGYYIASPFVYLVLAIWSVLPSRNDEARRRAMLAVFHRSFRGLHRVTRVIRMQAYIPSAPPTLPSPCVLVANHPTLMDVTAILATVPNTVTVVKPGIYNRILLGTALRCAGFLEGPERSTAQLSNMIDTAEERLAAGYNVLIFPEGTRSPANEVRPFSRAAFEIACRAKVPVVPIAIRCVPPWLSKELPIYTVPPEIAQMTVDFLAPLDPADLEYRSRALRNAARTAIVQQLEHLSAPTST